MNYKTHKIGGIGAGLLAFPVTTYLLGAESTTSILSLAGGLSVMSGILGSALPDIDHKGSYIGKKLKPVSFVVSSTCGHRGVTHAPLITTIFLALSMFFLATPNIYAYSIVLGFFAGIYSHIILDGFTKGGVPLLYPFNKKKYSLKLFVTGKKGEDRFRLILAIAVFFIAAKLI